MAGRLYKLYKASKFTYKILVKPAIRNGFTKNSFLVTQSIEGVNAKFIF